MRNTILSIFLLSIIVLSVGSCKNDNEGFKEYYHPMGNNPAMVIPWLIEVRKSFYGHRAIISEYKLNEEFYYAAQVHLEENGVEISPFTIYYANGKREEIYFHTDDVLESDQDEIYEFFIENAEHTKVLWTNDSKYSVYEDNIN